jgi:ABC-type branched-subunit amino acid transport system permease subunit
MSTITPSLARGRGRGGVAIQIALALVVTVFLWLFLQAKSQIEVCVLLVLAAVAVFAASRFGLTERIETATRTSPRAGPWCALIGTLALIAAFYDVHYVLLLICTVLLFSTACLGLTVQFGYVGIANFAGAAFFGIGSYTIAVLAARTGIPHLLLIVLSGVVSAAIGSILILPVLRTRGHYAALVTIAFGILFHTFVEVNNVLGGPQGLHLPGISTFGYSFGDGFTLFDQDVSFYVPYALLSVVIFGAAYGVIKRLERSWIGLSMDVVRTDETAAATFGIHIARWKVIAFMLGNFLAGVAGSVYGMMTGFVSPDNFTFSDSLLLVSIAVLGGLGNPLGLVPAAFIVLVLPQKLQFIQEYRFLFYAVVVIAILLFRPDGLLPRRTRQFFNNEVSR